MNQIKVKKLVLVITVAVLSLCLIPVVYGKHPSTSNRPIGDWLVGNPFGSSPGFADPDNMIVQRSLVPVVAANSHVGEIIETCRADKSILLTIYLEVYGMPFALRDLTAIGTDEEWFFVGVMDYTFEMHIVLEKHVPGGLLLDWNFGDLVTDNKGNPAPLIEPFGRIPSGPRNPGDFLPAWWLLYFYPYVVGGYFVYEDWVSVGSGNYIEPGWNPPFQGGTTDPVSTGEEGNVDHHQQVIISYDLDVNDPDVYQLTSWTVPFGVFKDGGILRESPLLIPETWPYEDLIIS
ncbi:MAG: hypothetical protein ACFE85_17075 [Candidatus Hodarchaeota archaeon]